MIDTYHLSLRGPLRLINPDGLEVTPRLVKAQGLLAILAMARGRPCHRAALQDKLWSDRGHVQGRDSLKKAIAELRRSFGADAAEMLRTEGGPVQLSLKRLQVDVFTEEGIGPHQDIIRPEFLEGIDIRDSQFDIWLREIRQALSDRPNVTAQVGPGAPTPQMRFSLGILPIVAASDRGDDVPLLLGDFILNRIITAFAHYEVFDVYDFRSEPQTAPHSVDVTLRLQSLQLSDSTTMNLTLRRVGDNEVIWGQERSFDARSISKGSLSRTITEIVDQITSALFRRNAIGSQERHLAAKHVLESINAIFRLEGCKTDAVSRSLHAAVELDPKSSYLAWGAYLMNFQLEETKGRNLRELRERADELASKALELDPYNPLTRSLLTHVYSFLFRDFERAACLIEPLQSQQPDLPLYYHSLAMLRFYTGDTRAAREAAQKCWSIGRHHPYAYAFSTALTQIDVVTGNHDRAVQHGETALALQRSSNRLFQPTLRYLGVAYAELRDPENAQRVWQLLQRQDPGFTHNNIDDERFPVPSREARELLRSGFRKLRDIIH